MSQPRVTIFMPVSRERYIKQMITSLEILQCEPDNTRLLILVDGQPELFKKVRALLEESKYRNREVILSPINGKPRQNASARRPRIAAIHNRARKSIGDCEYVFLVEDDGPVPSNALTKLLGHYQSYPYAGYIQGLELGRWRNPYVGAWRWDDIHEPSKIESIGIPDQPGLVPVDSGGLYCMLTKAEHYRGHEFAPLFGGTFGPDIGYGLALRRQGMQNYADSSIVLDHLDERSGSSISPANTRPKIVGLTKRGGVWRFIN